MLYLNIEGKYSKEKEGSKVSKPCDPLRHMENRYDKLSYPLQSQGSMSRSVLLEEPQLKRIKEFFQTGSSV